MKTTLFSSLLSMVLCAVPSLNTHADDVVIETGQWKITYVESTKGFKINSEKPTGGYRPALMSSFPEVTYDNVSGESRTVNSASFAEMAYAEREVDDEFGKGKCYSFTFTSPSNGDDVSMIQNFYYYEGVHDYLITDLSVSGDEKIRSNYLAPINTTSAYTLYLSNSNNRMLKVPFDNDGFVRYHKYHINGDMISYEVSALFEGDSRDGLILGSVEHNRWKSAVQVRASNNGKIEALKLFSGVSNSETRDVLPHGKIDGPTIASARMFIGFYDDWREGMKLFCEANKQIQPMRDTWKKGTPFGWQSWGVMANYNSYTVDRDISNYFNEVLKPAGFCNDQGVNIISIDSWDNLSSQNKHDLTTLCENNGQVAGTYHTPFCAWLGSPNDLNNVFYTDPQGNKYTFADCSIKVNGEPYMLDGAYCLDPTHPGTKNHIASEIRKMKVLGFKYVKLDFTSNGIVQADSYYNPKVKTAVEAYNEGFSYLVKKANEGEPLFIALSISPLFPYQYGNSRRVACDTWGSIGHSEFCLNAISGGWWTNHLYQYNDPDHLIFIGEGDQEFNTIGENRARMTSGAVSGMLLVGDNFSLKDPHDRGNAVLSRERAKTILMNKDVNEMGNLGRSFMPVYGYDEYNDEAHNAENSFMYHTDEYLYVAVLNYTESDRTGQIALERLNITYEEFDEIKELWMGENIVKDELYLNYSVPAKDARIYRFHKKGTGVNEVEKDLTGRDVFVTLVGEGKMEIRSESPMKRIEVFGMQGQLLQALQVAGKERVTLSLQGHLSMVVLRIMTEDGQIRNCKVWLKK